MLVTPAEQLTNRFYEWEVKGRGWLMCNEPVDLEPGFIPFIRHALPEPKPRIDDGRKPGLIGSVIELFKLLIPAKQKEAEPEEEGIEAYPFQHDSPLSFFAITVPKGHKVPAYETEQFLLLIASSKCPVSFEIIATHEKIVVQCACSEGDKRHIRNQLKAYFPACIITDQEDSLQPLFERPHHRIDYALSDEFMRPLAMPGAFDPDPFISLFAVLDNLDRGQSAAVQVLFKGTRNPWAESILRSVHTNNGAAFFEDAPEMASYAKQKVSAPFFAACIRVVASAAHEQEAKGIAWSVGSALVHLSKAAGNKLIPLQKGGYDTDAYQDDILLRHTHRLGMLVNSKELVSFVHFPSASIVSAKLVRDTKKTKAVPSIVQGNRLVLGLNSHHGNEIAVSLSDGQRLKHCHIIGATGTGKSTLLLHMLVQDIENGSTCAVLDPHGDLIEKVLRYVPQHRIADVVLIDPADAEFPIAFNILSAHTQLEKDLLSSDLVAAFRRHSTSWGDAMNSVLANAIMAFLESTEGGTLADLRRFLVEKPYREKHLKTVTDPSIVYYWQKEYPLLKTNSIGSILTRLDSFLRPKLIRNMVCQKRSLDFERLMDTNKIILVKLSQGLIGEENSYLLGSFIVSKLQQAAMSRQAKPEERRKNCYLYIDEFQHFITPSMSAILSGARKYHMGLILAHQSLQQVQQQDAELLSAVIANAGTRICFRLGDTDAKKLEDGFAFFDAKDLQNLGVGEAIARVERPEFDFSMKTEPVPASDVPPEVLPWIIGFSRKVYGTPREEVEAVLFKTMQPDEPEPAAQKERPTKKPEPEEYIPFVEVAPEAAEEPIQPERKEEVQEQQPVVKPVKTPDPIEKPVKRQVPTQHTYLKSLIKRMAEDRGFKVTLEENTPDGKGRVDVGLLRNDKKIACEISVTTDDAWEFHNAEKCLAAGYDPVIICSTDRRNLEKIQKLVRDRLDAKLHAKVLTFVPEELFFFLDQTIAQEMTKEERTKGFRVTVEYRAVPEDSAKQKREHIVKTVIDSIRKNKTKKKNL